MHSKKFTDDAIKYFYDEDDGFFWFTSGLDPVIIARKKETIDNVIPASNSEMAKALFVLGDYFDEKNYSDIASKMLGSVEENLVQYPSSYSNWLDLMMNLTFPFNEIVITGNEAQVKRKKLAELYLPQTIFAGSTTDKNYLPLLESRFRIDKTLIYICSNKTCKMPVETAEEAVSLLK